MVLTTGAAFAAWWSSQSTIPLYRSNTADGDPDTQGGIYSFRLNAKTALSNNVDLFARFAAQSLSGDKIGPDFSKAKYGNSVAVIDQYGIIVKDKDFNIK